MTTTRNWDGVDPMAPTAPDIDAQMIVNTHSMPATLFRLRVWHRNWIAVATELPTNEGLSITNAAEYVYAMAREVITAHPGARTGPYLVIEHYPHTPPTFDVVDIDTDGWAFWTPLHRAAPMWVRTWLEAVTR